MNRALTSLWKITVRTDIPLEVKPSPPDRWSQPAVIVFACFVALLVVLLGFFTDRNGDVDELAMYNPAYMLTHYGKLTFPSYPYQEYFDDPVIVHPPVHVAFIGLLGRLGFTWYYAEATPAVLFYLLSIVVIVRSLFPSPVKLGLLFSIGFLMLLGENFGLTFGTRPEGALQGAWFLGLLLLESGRLDKWNPARLFLGAFVLAWASGMHYYAGVAFTGIAVYLIWAVRSLGWTNAKAPIAAICAGGCLFGIPYAALYLLPSFKKILTAIQLVQGSGGIRASIGAHLRIYREWSQFGDFPALIRRPFALGIPFLVFSTAVLGFIPSTRGLALAALPLQLFVLVFASHKQPAYLLHEIAMFSAAVAVGTLVLADYLWRRIPSVRMQRMFVPFAAAFLFLYLATNNPVLQSAVVSAQPRVHEGDLARAATRAILGPHARVAGRYGAWYTSGAAYWWDVESSILVPWHYDPAKFFANFDAVADYAHMSGVTPDISISSSYAAGILKLRGFYFGENNEQLRLVLLSPHQVAQVVGYATRNGRLYRFEENPAGDYQVIAATCPRVPLLDSQNWKQRWPEAFSNELLLPNPTPEAQVLVTVLAPHSPEPAGWIGRSCKEIAKINGSLQLADREALLDSLRRTDQPIQFPKSLDQMPGYIGVGLPAAMTPPAESVRLTRVLALSNLRRSAPNVHVEREPQIVITTPLTHGAFAAFIPVKNAASVPTPSWVLLRLKVTSGRIGFAALNRNYEILGRTRAAILKSNEPQDVVLQLPNLHDVANIVIFNEADSAGQFSVLDAAVLVTPADWERNQAVLSAVR